MYIAIVAGDMAKVCKLIASHARSGKGDSKGRGKGGSKEGPVLNFQTPASKINSTSTGNAVSKGCMVYSIDAVERRREQQYIKEEQRTLDEAKEHISQATAILSLMGEEPQQIAWLLEDCVAMLE